MRTTGRRRRCDDRSGGTAFTITLRNLGPIREAALRIAPLTVLIGPGNTGKSYAAIAVHSLVRAVNREKRLATTAPDLNARPGPASRRTLAACKKSIDGGLDAVLDALNTNRSARIPARMSGAIARHCLTRILADGLAHEMDRNMPVGPRGLVRFGCKSLQIGASNGAHTSALRWGASAPPGAIIRDIAPIAQTLVEDEGKGGDRLLGVMPRAPEDPIVYRMSNSMANNRLRRQLPQAFYAPIARKIFPGMPDASHYLPASRSGILDAYGSAPADAIRSPPGASGGGPRARSVPGTVADFVADLVEMTGRKGALFDLGAEMEASLLRGRIDLRKASRMAAPEMAFRHRGRDVPSRSASSSVSELAPLILYLKHAVRPSELLVIEEPEAHLHPASQAVLAKFIVRMIRAGLYVLATTHSEIMLEEFSKCLEAGRLSGSSRDDIFGDSMAYLRQGEIAPYAFALDGGGWGTAREMPHSEDDGIDEDEFIRIQEALHDEAVKIEGAKAAEQDGPRA